MPIAPARPGKSVIKICTDGGVTNPSTLKVTVSIPAFLSYNRVLNTISALALAFTASRMSHRGDTVLQ